MFGLEAARIMGRGTTARALLFPLRALLSVTCRAQLVPLQIGTSIANPLTKRTGERRGFGSQVPLG